MLELRPNCECCDKDLPPDSSEALICSYECTFCADCVYNILHNVCPNCGGGFVPRPTRPASAHRTGISLEHQPASDKRVQSRFSAEEIAEFAEGLRGIPPAER